VINNAFTFREKGSKTKEIERINKQIIDQKNKKELSIKMSNQSSAKQIKKIKK